MIHGPILLKIGEVGDLKIFLVQFFPVIFRKFSHGLKGTGGMESFSSPFSVPNFLCIFLELFYAYAVISMYVLSFPTFKIYINGGLHICCFML